MPEARRPARKSLRLIQGGLVDELDRAAARLSYLAEASRILSTALSDRDCFSKLVGLIVPHLADWCTLCRVDGRGCIRRVATRHINPVKARMVARLEGRHPPRQDAPIGIPYAIRTGRSELVPDFDADVGMGRYSNDPGLVRVVKAVGIRSYITVPLIAHGQVLGALWLVASDSGRVYDREDLRLAEDIASRAALALYHLLRYGNATRELERCQIEHSLRETFITETRHDALNGLTAVRLSIELLKRGAPASPELLRRTLDGIDGTVRVIESTRIGVARTRNSPNNRKI